MFRSRNVHEEFLSDAAPHIIRAETLPSLMCVTHQQMYTFHNHSSETYCSIWCSCKMRVLLSRTPWEYVFPILLSLRLPSSGVWTLSFVWWVSPWKSGSGNVGWIACVFQFVWFQLVTHSVSLCVCVWIFLHKNTSKNYIIYRQVVAFNLDFHRNYWLCG